MPASCEASLYLNAAEPGSEFSLLYLLPTSIHNNILLPSYTFLTIMFSFEVTFAVAISLCAVIGAKSFSPTSPLSTAQPHMTRTGSDSSPTFIEDSSDSSNGDCIEFETQSKSAFDKALKRKRKNRFPFF